MSDRFKKLEMIKSNGRHTQETIQDLEIKLQQLEQEEAPLAERQNLQRRINEMKKDSPQDKHDNDDNHDHHNHHNHHDHKEPSHEHHEKNKSDDHKIGKGASKFHELSKSHKHHKKHD